MAKVFQVLNGFIYWDATPKHGTLEAARACYAPDIEFVETPDYVFEGWGYDETKTGDDRFIKPIPPEGWKYDEETGTFYPEDFDPTAPQPPTIEERVDDLEAAFGILTEGLI